MNGSNDKWASQNIFIIFLIISSHPSKNPLFTSLKD